MPHHLTGFQSVDLVVTDLEDAIGRLSKLGFSLTESETDTGRQAEKLLSPVLALGNLHLRLRVGAVPGLGAVRLGCDNARAAVSALGDVSLPGLSTSVTEAPAFPASLHANGAVSVASLTLLLEDPVAAAGAFDRIFGLFSATPTDDMLTVHGCGPMLFVVSPDGFDHLHANLKNKLPAGDGLAAIAVAVADLDVAADYLTQQGVRFYRGGPSLAIHPEDCLGLGLELVPAGL